MTPLREVTKVSFAGTESNPAGYVRFSQAAIFSDQILAIHRAGSFADLAGLGVAHGTNDTWDWLGRGLSRHTDLRWAYLAERQGLRSKEAQSLTPQEHAVLRGVSQGLTDAQIADLLHIARRTASKHVEGIYRKLGVETRTAASLLCKRWSEV